MAALRAHHGALFSQGSPHMMSFSSRSSITVSGGTSADMLSTRQFACMNHPRKRPMNTETRLQTSSRMWLYALLGISLALLVWAIYCSVRYFVALQIYGGDAVRSRYAIAMGTTSTFTFLTLTMYSTWTSYYYDTLPLHRSIILIFHSLAYFSSTLVMGLTVINLDLVLTWRVPHNLAGTARSLQGRCNWNLDIIWSGTGGACNPAAAVRFGTWLGAAIARLVITAVVLTAYHLAVHRHLTTTLSRETLPPITFARDVDDGDVTLRSSTTHDLQTRSRESHMSESEREPIEAILHDLVLDNQVPPRPLSFTEAGQVLSRVEGSELETGDDQESLASSDSTRDLGNIVNQPPPNNLPIPRSDSPEYLPISVISQTIRHLDAGADAFPQNPPPSSYHPPAAASSNTPQDFSSVFRSLVSRISRDTEEGMTLDSPSESRRENERVQFLGSYISRMSTIESLASREVPNSVRSPSRSDTGPSGVSGSPNSSHPESRNLSRNPTLNRGRDLDEVAEPLHPGPVVSGT